MQPTGNTRADCPPGAAPVGSASYSPRAGEWPGGAAVDDRRDRSIGDLIRELTTESSHLVRQEVNLAKVELQEKAAKFARNAAYLALGGLIAYSGFLILLVAITYGVSRALAAAGVDQVTRMWLAPLLVAAAVLIIGGILVAKAIATFKKEPITPERTAQSLQETKEWIKQRTT